MTIDFPQGVPEGCTAWLNQHVGLGVTSIDSRWKGPGHVHFEDCAWYYERRFRPYDQQHPDEQPTAGEYMPSITVRDPVKAMWFALRWTGA